MNKVLSVLLFPFVWLFGYLYRIIWYDLIGTIIQIFIQLGFSVAAIFRSGKMFLMQFGAFLWLLLTFPIVLIVDIPVGLVVTLMTTLDMCETVFTGEIDLWEAIKKAFSKNAKRKKRF